MRQDNIAVLQDTLRILELGCYTVNNEKKKLKLTRSQMEEARVFLPKEVQAVSEFKDFRLYKALKEFDYDGMKDKDTFYTIDFAVLDHSADQYNFKEFSRNFTDFTGTGTRR
ncbi:MAG: hypothetical protein Q4F25_05360 [Eubacteriales bacterium]|nr:hypothetical protein [Eubacteriales bacterium]